MGGQSQKKHERILKSAQELFWKYGYNAASVDQIAAESGVSKMTIYKYYHSKEDLFAEVLKNNIEYHMNRIIENISEKYHTFDKIQYMYVYTIQLSKEYPAILIKDIIERPNLVRKITAFKQELALPLWRYILKDGIAKKELRALDVDFVSNLLMNLPNAFTNLNFLNDEEKKLKLYENFFDFIKFGLLGGMERHQYPAEREGAEDAEKRVNES